MKQQKQAKAEHLTSTARRLKADYLKLLKQAKAKR